MFQNHLVLKFIHRDWSSMEAPEATVEGQLGSTNCYRCEKEALQ